MAYSDNFVTDIVTLVEDMVTAEKLVMSEMLYEKSFATNNIATQHQIVTGVRAGHTVPILKDTPNVDSFPFVDPKVCAPNECDVSHEFSSMKWDLGLLECRVPICLRSFDENFLLFFNQWRQTQEGTPDLDTAIIDFINSQFTKNLQIAQWRAAYFGDKASLSDLYNGIDGFFVQGEANPDNVVAITENTGVDFTAQQFATGEDVYNYLQAMYDKASLEPWFDPSRMEYRVTKSMAAKLVQWLNKLGKNSPYNCECLDPQALTARNTFMLDGLRVNGIPVLTHSEWDMIINNSAELNGGGGNAARVNPHRAFLSTRSNLLIGTSETAALRSFDIWYSKDDKKVYLEGSSYLGAAIPMSEYVLAI